MNIPDKATEAARSALIGRNNNEPSKDARAAMEAAAPFIAAQAWERGARETYEWILAIQHGEKWDEPTNPYGDPK